MKKLLPLILSAPLMLALSPCPMGRTTDHTAAPKAADPKDTARELDRIAAAWLNEAIPDETKATIRELLRSYADIAAGNAGYIDKAIADLVFADTVGRTEYDRQNSAFADTFSRLQGYIGWEGDYDAPCIWADGTVTMRDRGNARATFGVSGLERGSVSWTAAEGYLPCWTSRYSKDGMTYSITHFADCVTYGGNPFEVLYTRYEVTNSTETDRVMPTVSGILARMTAEPKIIAPGETVTADYCIACDRFGLDTKYPDDSVFASMGTYDEHYEHMKSYWNGRLENIADIKLPGDYAFLGDAIKAGYIYTLIISDGYELHVGETEYDRVFDHDAIGILVTLVTLGHTEHFADYAATILKNIQYPDASWKFSFPFAVYLEKTDDYGVILDYFDEIKKNTHKIETEREVYKDGAVILPDGRAATIMMMTDDIDSDGYWTIDNFAGLFGLLSYSYICDRLDAKYGGYADESAWAKSLYGDMLESVIAVMKHTMEAEGFDYLSISMETATENTERKDPRDGNWASMFLFGRYNWDGYLFGAEKEGNMLYEKLDATYRHIIEAKKDALPSPYTMGGYPGASSAYNAGYYSAALAGNDYRTYGIEAYKWLLENGTSCPYGTWESVDRISDQTLLDRMAGSHGSGSCQHMWGQSVNTKVVLDSLIAERSDGMIIAGRGIPQSFCEDGKVTEVTNYLCQGGKRIGYRLASSGSRLTFTLTGDELDSAVSLELPVLVGNIASVSCGVTYDSITGTVTIPAGVREAVIEVGK